MSDKDKRKNIEKQIADLKDKLAYMTRNRDYEKKKLATLKAKVVQMKEDVELAGYDNEVDGAYHRALEDVLDVIDDALSGGEIGKETVQDLANTGIQLVTNTPKPTPKPKRAKQKGSDQA